MQSSLFDYSYVILITVTSLKPITMPGPVFFSVPLLKTVYTDDVRPPERILVLSHNDRLLPPINDSLYYKKTNCKLKSSLYKSSLYRTYFIFLSSF